MRCCLLLLLSSFVCLDRASARASIRDEEESPWSYRDPEAWGDDYPECNGREQSPINLMSFGTLAPLTPPLRLTNYNAPLQDNLILRNDGHTAYLRLPPIQNSGRDRPYITGASLRNRYEAQSLHFHWGSPSTKGSEHTVDERRYDVEMHIVHKNVRYISMEEALQREDGLAVLGVMFKKADSPAQYYPGLNKILDALPEIVNYNSSVKLNGTLSLGYVLGDLDTSDFFTYSGSLTTPPCSEVVTWLVFPRPLAVARSQIEKFYQLYDEHDEPLLDNFRPLQPRRNRLVFHHVTGFNPNFFTFPRHYSDFNALALANANAY